jgi:hypothetical protein
MKFPATLALLSLPLISSAQITIGPEDMPSAGDTMRFRTSTATGFDGADTGPGHAWHFEDLPLQGENADTAVAVESTPFLYQFFFNNGFLYPEYDADLALRGASINFQAVNLTNVFDYYKKTSSGYRNVGFGATINGLPASVQRQPVDHIYRFPLDHGDQDTSASSFVLTVPTLGTYGQSQVRYNEVDGWGTLYLPADTFEVLRVKSTLMIRDTLYVDQFGFGFTFPRPETIEYKWLAMGKDQPVLQITTLLGQPVLVRYVYDPEDAVGMDASIRLTGPAVYPNPATDRVAVACDDARNIELYDAQGRRIRRIASAAMQRAVMVDLQDVAPGVYTVRRSGEDVGTRLVVAR